MSNGPQSSASAQQVRLHKYLARWCGVGSLRACEKIIAEGRVQVNGETITTMGVSVDPHNDVVTVDGARQFGSQSSVTLMLNKPADYVTTMDDPQGRACVASLVPLDCYPTLYPVGRLDRDTTGLLLFSTDGQLGNLLIHPSHHVEKTYFAQVQGIPSEQALQQLRDGIELDDGLTAPAKVELLKGEDATAAEAAFGFGEAKASGTSCSARKMMNKKKNKSKPLAFVSITIHEGRKRQVRRMFEAVGCPVVALHRVSIGPLQLGDVPRGSWRLLSEEEVAALRNVSGC